MNEPKKLPTEKNQKTEEDAGIFETKLPLSLQEKPRIVVDQVLGQLNPEFVEWLMGWPMGWTALQPLGTDKFRQWSRSHGPR